HGLAAPQPPTEGEVARLRRRIDELLSDRQEERRRFDRTLGEIYASRSWRLTAPLRFLHGPGFKLRVKLWLRAQLLALPLGATLLALRRSLMPAQGAAVHAPDLLAAKTAFRAETNAALNDFLAGTAPLVLPRAERPQVSIVLVLWNQVDLTYACLTALAAETDVPLDVVIVDNASSDATGTLLARVEGATLVPQSENLGFLRAVNLAVPHCRAERVLLLNNDAVMRPGSLAAALATLESSPDIGAVGGRIVLPNGRLQEAGSIVWQDGSCTGYGRDLLPEAGEAMFRRDVDYASGAFFAVPPRGFRGNGRVR
ncbi:glycosyltransferase, partial [Elstera litoralis]|uniref:glycosyltransferase n=1 Tax=Elstera litoralis TaxID=552518 RepID=UPI0012ECF6D4